MIINLIIKLTDYFFMQVNLQENHQENRQENRQEKVSFKFYRFLKLSFSYNRLVVDLSDLLLLISVLNIASCTNVK